LFSDSGVVNFGTIGVCAERELESYQALRQKF
jgi:hypothetical protein